MRRLDRPVKRSPAAVGARQSASVTFVPRLTWVPAGGFFFQALQTDGIQIAGNSGIEKARRDRLLFEYLAQRLA